MTERARQALAEAEIVIGYKTYVNLVTPLLGHQQVESTGMKKEVARAQRAVELARQGYRVAVISSGDPGIYGMAGVVLEVLYREQAQPEVQVEIVPGVSAAQAAAAVAGAPLMHDCAFISLSDLLTPRELILKRVVLAAQGDFVIALYNPKSKGRPDLINQVQELLLRYRKPDTPVAVVRNAGREGESLVLSTLAGFTREEIDMFTTVIVGNSQSYVAGHHFITPRGYRL
ncbi:MAG TPA: precorrin-3B C(17)-methyltransferase [Clostridia bacterium]|nr:precorrin-3B C(17)-methyltransferase [Clostridia bacterium]